MDYQRLTQPAVADEFATCLVAIELSGESWLVGVAAPGSARPGLHKIAAGAVDELVRLIDRLRTRHSRVGRPARIVSCYEAGRDGFWLHRVLAEEGVANHVIDPASIRVDRRSRRAKTDRLDVADLLRVLAAVTRGEPDACSVVRVPSAAEEDAKRLHRERERLIGERVSHVNRIKALLALHGVVGFQPLRADRRGRLAEVRGPRGAALPAGIEREIGREIARLELIVAQIDDIEAVRDAALAAKAPSPARARAGATAARPGSRSGTADPAAIDPAADDPAVAKIRMLANLKSIAAQTATVLTREVFYREFHNRREVAGYVGLASSPFNSGGMMRDQGISKAGNPRARTAMIELAWLWLRYQSQSALSRWFLERTKDASGRVRRIMIVALARKLLVALWRYVETGLVPTGAVLKTA